MRLFQAIGGNSTAALAFITCLLGCSSQEFSGSGEVRAPQAAPANPEPKAKEEPLAPPAATTTPQPTETLPRAETPTDTFIGGSEEVFRIGDGIVSPNSECAAGVAGQKLKGTKFVFPFTVKEDKTTVSLSIDFLCGVSYPVNLATITYNGARLGNSLPLPINGRSLSLGTLTLNKGLHEIIVESIHYRPDNAYDDFTVGKVHVRSNKQISPGQVWTR